MKVTLRQRQKANKISLYLDYYKNALLTDKKLYDKGLLFQVSPFFHTFRVTKNQKL
jgi:hypothetical protein